MSLKVLDPYKQIIDRIRERLANWQFHGQLFDFDEVDNWPEDYVEENQELLFSELGGSTERIFDTLEAILYDRPDLAYDICEAIAYAIPPEENPEAEIYDYLQGFLNHSLMSEATEQLIVGWSCSSNKDLRSRARQMQNYLLSSLKKRVTEKIEVARQTHRKRKRNL